MKNQPMKSDFNMNSTYDYKKMIETDANQVVGRVPVEKEEIKTKAKSLRNPNRFNGGKK